MSATQTWLGRFASNRRSSRGYVAVVCLVWWLPHSVCTVVLAAGAVSSILLPVVGSLAYLLPAKLDRCADTHISDGIHHVSFLSLVLIRHLLLPVWIDYVCAKHNNCWTIPASVGTSAVRSIAYGSHQ